MSARQHVELVRRREFLKMTAVAGGAVFGLAGQARRPRKPMPHVIVLIPGIMGSVLQKDGRDVWAVSGGALVDLARRVLSGGNMLELLRLADGKDEDLGDGISATRIFQDIHLLPGLWKIDGYSNVSQSILNTFDVARGENFFEFPYDWRRDNRVAAKRLARETRGWLKTWRAQSGSKDAKLILVAHSMGGLVARHFLECQEGWKDARSLVTFGTPYAGSLKALDCLSNGFSKKLEPFTGALPDVVRSFTSVYQLLPTYACYDAGQGEPAVVGEMIGIPNVNARKAADALAFHREISAAVETNTLDPAYSRQRYRLHPIVGTYQPTLQWARLLNGKVEVLPLPPPNLAKSGFGDTDGDGTVPRRSAEFGRDQPSVMWVKEMHGSLQNAGAVLVQLEGILSAASDLVRRSLDDDALSPIKLEIDDAYGVDEPVVVRAASDSRRPAMKLFATLVRVRVGANPKGVRHNLVEANGVHEATLGRLPEGTYRLTVRGNGAQAVTDVFVVAGSHRSLA